MATETRLVLAASQVPLEYRVCKGVEEGFEFDNLWTRSESVENADDTESVESFVFSDESYYGGELTMEEEELFDGVREGNIDEVKRILSSSPSIRLQKRKNRLKIDSFDEKFVLVLDTVYYYCVDNFRRSLSFRGIGHLSVLLHLKEILK